MNAIVCVKYQKKNYIKCKVLGYPCQIGSQDLEAVKVACLLKSKYQGKITVISMGPERARKHLGLLYALGVDEIILLSDIVYAGSDTLVTSEILSKMISKLDHDFVLCGIKSDDSATGQVPLQISARLNYGYKEYAENRFEDFRLDSAKNKSVIVVGRCGSRTFPTLTEIKGANGKEVFSWSNQEIGKNNEDCGIAGSPTKVKKLYKEKDIDRKRGVFWVGKVDDSVKRMLKYSGLSLWGKEDMDVKKG